MTQEERKIKMSCVNLKQKLNHKFECKRTKKEITLTDCKNCSSYDKKEPKTRKYTLEKESVLKRTKMPLKRVSKKREFVSEKTYNKVYERDKGCCVICGTINNLNLHHINGRGKDKTDNPDNCCMLCQHCHLEVVHKSNKYWRSKLNEYISTLSS